MVYQKVSGKRLERDIEQVLVRDVTKLLLELGTGFAFLGNQYHLNVGGDDFYIDLLFYNLKLQAGICWSAKLLSVSRGRHFEKRAGQSVHWFASVQKQKQCGRRIFAQGYFKADWCKRI